MFWQHIFIPVLPSHLMDYLSAPMPFLIGVPQPLFCRTKASELGDVVILDIDNKTFESPFNDVDNLPSEIVHNLMKSLSPSRDHLGDAVARAFLQALVHLIGGYREALKYRQGEKVSFSDDDFIKSRSSSSTISSGDASVTNIQTIHRGETGIVERWQRFLRSLRAGVRLLQRGQVQQEGEARGGHQQRQ